MKKFLTAILCFVMGCLGLVACNKEDNPTPTQTVEHTITYAAVIDDGTEKTTTSIPAGMYKTDGTYPTKYVEGTGATISDLKEYTDEDFKYTFGGWFSDEACETAFESIGKDAKDDVKVYAKVTRTAVAEPAPEDVFSGIEYYYVLDNGDAVLGHFTHLQKTDASLYPATYKEGTGVDVGDYNETKTVTENSKQIKYTFGGWYTDADCETEFDGTISTTQTGKVKLYAKITSEDVTPEPEDDDKNWTKNY